MSAARFKSKEDYFSKRTGLAEKVLMVKPPRPGRKRGLESAIPAALLRVHFCKTVDYFQIEGRGKYSKGEFPLDDALREHLNGESTVLVNPLSHAGETAFTVVRFDVSEMMGHPFSKARKFSEELKNYGIPSSIEVAEGGKGHYHLWIFHEEPVVAWPFSESLIQMGKKLFGILLETVPSIRGEEYLPLPLQGESMLLQRRVFVNAVGKMIKDQGNVLQNLEFCPKERAEAFAGEMKRLISPAQPIPKPAPAKAVPEVRPPAPAPESVKAVFPKPLIQGKTPPQKAFKPPAISSAPRLTEKKITESIASCVKPAEKSGEPTISIEKSIPPAVRDIPVIPEADASAKKAQRYRLYLSFSRCGMSFVLEAQMVERVAGKSGMVPRPNSGCIFGALEQSGRVVAVLDPAAFFGEKTEEPGERARIIVLGETWRNYGFLADSVSGTVSLRPVERFSEGGGAFLRGVITQPDGERLFLPDVEEMIRRRTSPQSGPEPGIAFPGPEGQYVLFSIENRLYDIPAGLIRKVISGRHFLSSQKLKIFDMRSKTSIESLSYAGRAEAKQKRILTVDAGAQEVGIPVESILGIRDIPSTAFERVTETMADGMPVVAIARLSKSERPAFILNPESMLPVSL